jgi:Flp pilus assembly protein TadD
MDRKMQKLEPPESHVVSAALGWLGLGNAAEAKAELEKLGGGFQNHPDVLEARWEISAIQEDWTSALQLARALVHYAPDRASGWLHQAYSLRRSPNGSIRQAWTALLPAFDLFPREPIICYNLSCYACQLQLLDAARVWLKRAAVIAGKEEIKRIASSDPDLQPLWPEIPKLC